jgi:hypothetical protein
MDFRSIIIIIGTRVIGDGREEAEETEGTEETEPWEYKLDLQTSTKRYLSGFVFCLCSCCPLHLLRWYSYTPTYCYGSGMLYLPAHVALCHMTTRLAWRPLFQSLRLFFYFFFLSFRSSHLGLPIDRVLALLLTHHRSTIDWVRDIYPTILTIVHLDGTSILSLYTTYYS